ncbi:MAG: tRNA lysidine(34) synthetase TilS [Balneolaceae bacterium]|nr:tRNA lysidine(34) synthetase TilS [Balneolaceae bacterium]
MSRSELSPIERRVKKHINSHFNDPASARFVLAVSGGPDSMALMHLLHKLGIDLIAAHVNYQKRGGESDRDQELVEKKAKEYGYEVRSLKVEPEASEGMNFQNWARTVRYRFFRDLKQNNDAAAIVTAHHQDDQVETILQKIFRGAGLASWFGMEIREEELFRPLLDSSQAEIDRYVEEESVAYRVDRSNLESAFARNFLRNEWLAELEQFFPGWRQNVLRIREHASQFGAALDHILDEIKNSKDRISRKQWLELQPDLRRSIMLHWLKQKRPGVAVSSEALGELRHAEALSTGKSIQLTDDITLMRDREWFKLVFTGAEPASQVELRPAPLQKKKFRFNDLQFWIEDYGEPDFAKRLYLDVDKIVWPLKLRYWSDGDRFQPLGMDGRQNVADHLTNRKVSAAEKQNALVLQSFEDTICAVIFPLIENRHPPGTISEQMKCDDSTTRALVVELKE